MPPKEKKESSSGFTARDLDLIAAAIQSTKTPVEIDYKVFAEKAGLGGAPSAKASWHGLKKKMEKLNGVASPGGTPNEKAEKGSKKRKADEVQEGEDGGEGDGKEETPTGKAAKKGRKAPVTKAKGKKAAVVQAEAEVDEHVDDETPTPEGKDQGSGEVDGEEKLEEVPTDDVGENIKVES
ncbi:hypothetical protein KC331_g4768 [Hortaea werneckii]|uniref:Uncharacterized protein n=1 Tax=Hortaea werneckii TaxID=91943 RepID=A0A3M7D8E6_HORWE|nr:hypothetical protein KC331_g4768 [Hortaea werneckii]KAI7712609.1 hypothetical protein KC353_g8148 [Hortaea werneckii]RMY60552.1 hypothetical protein D0865_01464 [Hortaea werneckii]